MDIKSKDLDVVSAAEMGAEVILRHPGTDEPLDIKFKVVGKDSKRVYNALRVVGNRRLNSNTRETLDKIEADGIALLVACTVGWENLQEDGEDVPFTPEAAQRIYKEYKWIREQVDAFVQDRANFLKTGSAS